MSLQSISPELARRLVLNAQLLDGNSGLPAGKQGVVQTIGQLGYVQIDTLSVVERAHHHTLWTRNQEYQPFMLDELQAQDKLIFEYWGHAASYLPMADYRFYLPKMRAFEDPGNGWHHRLREKYQHFTPPVLERIRREGVLSSKDFERPPGSRQGGWWDWKPAKTALELLFWQGKLMVAGRRGFQRIYDLTERVLPAWVDTRFPREDELGAFFVRRSLQAMGIAQQRDMQLHLDGVDQIIFSQALADLLEAGEIIPLTIGDGDKKPYYALKTVIEQTNKLRETHPLVFILSPFDNLIIQRGRTRRLFGFEYSIECYLPVQKRTHGYFVLPILWGGRFVARMDAKADRKNKTLLVHSLTLEPGLKDVDAFLNLFSHKVADFAHFNQCEIIMVENTHPRKLKSALTL